MSELVKWMKLLIILSRDPSYMVVTLIVKGVPAATAEGAVMSRVACGVAQLSVINTEAVMTNFQICELRTLPDRDGRNLDEHAAMKSVKHTFALRGWYSLPGFAARISAKRWHSRRCLM